MDAAVDWVLDVSRQPLLYKNMWLLDYLFSSIIGYLDFIFEPPVKI
jgi:hypothetical protein